MSRCSSSGNMQLNAWNCRRRGDLKPGKGTGLKKFTCSAIIARKLSSQHMLATARE
jgi:hypothetical protein